MTASAKQKTGFSKWLPVILMSLGLFVVIIDTTIINVSILNVVEDLNSSIHSVQSMITMYALVMAALLIVGGETWRYIW